MKSIITFLRTSYALIGVSGRAGLLFVPCIVLFRQINKIEFNSSPYLLCRWVRGVGGSGGGGGGEWGWGWGGGGRGGGLGGRGVGGGGVWGWASSSQSLTSISVWINNGWITAMQTNLCGVVSYSALYLSYVHKIWISIHYVCVACDSLLRGL